MMNLDFKKFELPTFIIVGGGIGFLFEGLTLGIVAGTLVFIASRIEKFLEIKNEG